MKRPGILFAFLVAILAVPSFGAAIGVVDTACNPTVTTPAVGGCTWYNFFESLATGQPSNGSSFTNYYVASGAPQWTIADTTGFFTLRVLDGGHQGDTFDVYDNNVFLGTTSATSIDVNHECANDLSGFPGNDPAACWNDPLMSRGTFLLGPSAIGHSINITWNQKVPGGDSRLQFFEVNTAAAPPGVPEPTSIALMAAGLCAICLLTRLRKV